MVRREGAMRLIYGVEMLLISIVVRLSCSRLLMTGVLC